MSSVTISPNGKHLALDGRLASKLSLDSSSSSSAKTRFSLFWLIEQTAKKADANLVLEYAKANFDIKVELGKKQSKQSHSAVEMPYLTNPSDMAAHTRLVALQDSKIQKISQG